MVTQLEGPAGHNQDPHQHALRGSSKSFPKSRNASCPFLVRSHLPGLDEVQSTAPGQPDIQRLISVHAGRSSGIGGQHDAAATGLPQSPCLHRTQLERAFDPTSKEMVDMHLGRLAENERKEVPEREGATPILPFRSGMGAESLLVFVADKPRGLPCAYCRP